MFGGSLAGLRPAELLILLKDRDGEVLLSASGDPPLQLYLVEGRVVCARTGERALSWPELVAALAGLYRAEEVAFLYRRGVRPRRCSARFSEPADRLVQETVSATTS